MKDFLNRYMAANRTLERQSRDELMEIFKLTSSAIVQGVGSNAFRPERAVNAALVDALMVGVGNAIRKNGRVNVDALKGARASLLANSEFLDAISTGTSQKPKVDLRIAKAIEAIG